MSKIKVKIKFTVSIHRVAPLPLKEGELVEITWRRGAASRSGETHKVKVDSANSAVWSNEEFSFESRLDYNKVTKKFSDKKISLTVRDHKSSGFMRSKKNTRETESSSERLQPA